jgi:hypothetical protein
MSVVSKPLEAITVDDLQSLIDAGARETAVLKFKGSLPLPTSRCHQRAPA